MKPPSGVGERLRAARLARGYQTATEAAKKYQLNFNTYASHEGGSRNIPLQKLRMYAKMFDVDEQWLLTGTGRGPVGLHGADIEPIPLTRRLPLIRHLEDAALKDIQDWREENFLWAGSYIALPSDFVPGLSDQVIAVIQHDGSMDGVKPRVPVIYENDYVIVDLEVTELRYGKAYYIRDQRGDYLLRQLRLVGEDGDSNRTFELVPNNESYLPRTFNENELDIFGMAVGYFRAL